MDEDALRRHFELIGVDTVAASDLYTDDAVLEYVQSGERIRGRANITASRQAYPGPSSRFVVQRTAILGSTAVVEMVMTVVDEPHPVVAVLALDGDSIKHERIYICEPWPAPDYRAAFVEGARPT